MRLKCRSTKNRNPGMWNNVMAASIEVVTLLLAEIVGLLALWHAHSWSEVALVFTFAIACGGLGSRFSAMSRELVNERGPSAVRVEAKTGSSTNARPGA